MQLMELLQEKAVIALITPSEQCFWTISIKFCDKCWQFFTLFQTTFLLTAPRLKRITIKVLQIIIFPTTQHKRFTKLKNPPYKPEFRIN